MVIFGDSFHKGHPVRCVWIGPQTGVTLTFIADNNGFDSCYIPNVCTIGIYSLHFTDHRSTSDIENDLSNPIHRPEQIQHLLRRNFYFSL